MIGVFFFGLPHIFHPDEGFEVYRALRLGMGEFDLEQVAKGGYYFLLFFEYGVYFVWMYLIGTVSGVSEFALSFIRDPTPFWMIGRITTAVLGVCTVFLVWWQGRSMGGEPWSGLLGACFLAVSYRHVIESHYITVDVPMTLFAFWSIFMIVEDVEGRQRLNPYLFAFVAAFAILNKLPAIVLFVPYFLGALFRGGLRGNRGALTWSTLAPALGAMVIYVLANPTIIIKFTVVVHFLGEIFLGLPEQGNDSPGIEQQKNLWVFYLNALWESQGIVVSLLVLLGAAIVLVKRSNAGLLHLSFIVPLFVLTAGSTTSHLYYERYIVPLLPGLCLLGGFGAEFVVTKLRIRTPVLVLAGVAVVIVAIIEPGMASVRFNQKLAKENARTLTSQWIEQHIPAGSRILIEGFPEDTAQISVPLQNSNDNVQAMIKELETSDPNKALFWRLRLQVRTGPTYDLITVDQREDWGSLCSYGDQGVEYVVLRPNFFLPGGRDFSKYRESAVQSRFRFYDELRGSDAVELRTAFDPSKIGGRGYLTEVWELR